MKKYLVVLDSGFFKKREIVTADYFKRDYVGPFIEFFDKDDKKVALFNKFDVDYIKMLEKKNNG